MLVIKGVHLHELKIDYYLINNSCRRRDFRVTIMLIRENQRNVISQNTFSSLERLITNTCMHMKIHEKFSGLLVIFY
ncbi:hypothetical protein JHK82_043781 [Glycine max]|uniref:Uncharacterized protein n=1 Tax=Glycine max TaxID=3847 RepID=A0A0R0G631_SOYBN|nr:hypothetical protein JHK86_043663 [Glycine max]KAG5106811.1 hypothetical protein JHK82_043781 [Glycine max]KAH1148821.1 hypothetical protein GYH30_043450 [Glycine max]KRH13670.1 hypothetical protein GLYMA_15G255500v4 [Glycine max]